MASYELKHDGYVKYMNCLKKAWRVLWETSVSHHRDSLVMADQLLSLRAWFWDRNFWLPEYSTWESLEEAKKHKWVQNGELFLCFPFAVVLIALRFLFERLVDGLHTLWSYSCCVIFWFTPRLYFCVTCSVFNQDFWEWKFTFRLAVFIIVIQCDFALKT